MLAPKPYRVWPGQQPAYDRFFEAVRSGNVDRVRDSLIPPLNLDTLLMIDDGRPPMDGFGNGETALHMASRAGHAETVAFLLSQGAYVDPLSQEDGIDFPPPTPLFHAAYFTHGAVVRTLLEHGADINIVGDLDGNAVHHILWNKKVVIPEFFELFQVFVQYGQDLNALAISMHGTVLNQAVLLGNFELMQWLLDHGAELNSLHGDDIHYRPLNDSVRLGNFPTTKYLLERGAKVDESALLAARSFEMFEFLCQHADRDTVRESRALHHACSGPSLDRDIILYLLRMNVNLEAVDDQGDTAFLRACSYSSTPLDVMELLVRNGANPLATRIKTRSNDKTGGETALHRAASRISPRLFQFLLAAGIDINVLNETGQSALMRCAYSMGDCGPLLNSSQTVETYERLEGLLILKNAGADGSLRDDKQRTALHYLALGHDSREKFPQSTPAAKILLQAGADPKAVDADGKTAIDMFAGLSDHETVTLLSK